MGASLREEGMRGGDPLIVMAKAPRPGKVKTRMCPPLSHRRAAEFYACLLEDIACETTLLRGVRRYLFHTPPGGKAVFLAASFSCFLLRKQAGNDLRERMARAVGEAFAGGGGRGGVIRGRRPPPFAGGGPRPVPG